MLRNAIALAAIAAAGAAAQDIELPDSLSGICDDADAFQSCAATEVTSVPACIATVDTTDEDAAIPCFCSALDQASDCLTDSCGSIAAGLAAVACGTVDTTATATATADADADDTSSDTTDDDDTDDDEDDDDDDDEETDETSASNGLIGSGFMVALFAGLVALL